jgi:threonine dehydratase
MSVETSAATIADKLTDEVDRYLQEIDELNLSFAAPEFYESSTLRGNRVIFVNDTVQEGNTFKRRGALVAAHLALARCDVHTFETASAGNHGIGLSLAAKELGRSANIHCRSDANAEKVSKMRSLGANVLNIHGTLPDALASAMNSAEDDGHYFIHPYNQSEVIAGQATLGIDVLSYIAKQNIVAPVEILVPVGGGGLYAGVSIANKLSDLGQDVRVIGVEVENKADTLWCEGTAAVTGSLPNSIIHDPRAEAKIITIRPDQVARAMFDLKRRFGINPEGAGVVAPGGTIIRAAEVSSDTVLMPLITGANPSNDTWAKAEELVFGGCKAT